MRTWMIPPELLCTNHLLGEHGEIHKFRTSFVKEHKITGRLFPVVQIEPANMGTRHDLLAFEMQRRGYSHTSPYTLPDLSYLSMIEKYSKVDLYTSFRDLSQRCPQCKANIKQFLKGVQSCLKTN